MSRGAVPPALLVAIFILCAGVIHYVTADVSDPPLVQAAKAGNTAQIARLLEDGADPNAHDRLRNTALIYAARDGALEIAKALIAKGGDVNWQDGERVTPLILASHKNHIELVRLLLTHKADRELRDKWARTALEYAMRRGSDDPIAVLLRAAD